MTYFLIKLMAGVLCLLVLGCCVVACSCSNNNGSNEEESDNNADDDDDDNNNDDTIDDEDDDDDNDAADDDDDNDDNDDADDDDDNNNDDTGDDDDDNDDNNNDDDTSGDDDDTGDDDDDNDNNNDNDIGDDDDDNDDNNNDDDTDLGCVSEPGYQLLWEDHFEGNTLDTQYWRIVEGGSSNWNNTAINDPRVVEVSDGTLKLRAIKNPDFNGDLSTVQMLDRTTVWTGAVDTQKKVDFRYGKVEIRARLEAVPRAWPAIWMMPTESIHGGNPDSGEIDIVERLNLDSYYYSTVHTKYHVTNRDDPERYTTESADAIDQWTVFAIEWDADKIVFLRDGNSYHTVNRGSVVTDPEWHRWPFNEEFYIILSQQIGGGWVDGEAAGSGLVLQDADLPYQMEIDYVRICQLAP